MPAAPLTRTLPDGYLADGGEVSGDRAFRAIALGVEASEAHSDRTIQEALMTDTLAGLIDDPRRWPHLQRHEEVRFRPDMLMRETTLGELRGFLREIADWADASLIDLGSGGLVAKRPLPLATAHE